MLMLVAVILGAFGAHGLEGRLAAKQLASYQTGVSYHLLHALGLVAVGVIAQVTTPGRLLEWSARLMLLGIACFSGSIYLLTAGAPRALGAVTPVGGLSFTAAWMLLALHVLRRPG
jgi:uncharacterized membrane protein YgdD (TMEM256/DUF423 family)